MLMPGDTTPPSTADGRLPSPRVAHVLPGRVRMSFERHHRSRARELAGRLAAHPDVHRVRWVEAIQSVTVHFDPRRGLADILATLPDHHPALPPQPAELDWARILVPTLLALLPLGPFGGAVTTFVGELHSQLRPAG